MSPRARRHHVAHGTYDHTSVLAMIEWRWGLPALTARDAAARNLAEVLDFANPPDLSAPRWPVPAAASLPCPAGEYADYEDWRALARLARAYDWPSA
jgi:phospholipase C